MAEYDCKSEQEMEENAWEAYQEAESDLEIAEIFVAVYEGLLAECYAQREEAERDHSKEWPLCEDEITGLWDARADLQQAEAEYILRLGNYGGTYRYLLDCESGHKGFRNLNIWGRP